MGESYFSSLCSKLIKAQSISPVVTVETFDAGIDIIKSADGLPYVLLTEDFSIPCIKSVHRGLSYLPVKVGFDHYSTVNLGKGIRVKPLNSDSRHIIANVQRKLQEKTYNRLQCNIESSSTPILASARPSPHSVSC